MATPNDYTIRDIEPSDAEQWQRLYRGYRAFYRLPADDAAVATTWGWLLGRHYGLRGIVVVTPEGELVALANVRTFARPGIARMGLQLDDLFTAPNARGRSAGTALVHRAAEIAAEDNATVVRWITESDNATARSVYDSVAGLTGWVTYEMRPQGS